MRPCVPAALPAAVLLAAAALAGCARSNPKPGPAPPPPAITCATDSDCAVVPESCCGCTAGGKQRAIAASQRGAYEREREERCADTMCPQVMSTDPSCYAAAVCRNGACELGKPAGEAP